MKYIKFILIIFVCLCALGSVQSAFAKNFDNGRFKRDKMEIEKPKKIVERVLAAAPIITSTSTLTSTSTPSVASTSDSISTSTPPLIIAATSTPLVTGTSTSLVPVGGTTNITTPGKGVSTVSDLFSTHSPESSGGYYDNGGMNSRTARSLTLFAGASGVMGLLLLGVRTFGPRYI